MLLEDFSALSLLFNGASYVLTGSFLMVLPLILLFLFSAFVKEGVDEVEEGQARLVLLTVAVFSAFFAVGVMIKAVLSSHALLARLAEIGAPDSFLGVESSPLGIFHVVCALMMISWAVFLYKGSVKKGALREIIDKQEWPIATIGSLLVGFGLAGAVGVKGVELQNLLNAIQTMEQLNKGAALIFFYALGLGLGCFAFVTLVSLVFGRFIVNFEPVIPVSSVALALVGVLVFFSFFATIGLAIQKLVPFLGMLG